MRSVSSPAIGLSMARGVPGVVGLQVAVLVPVAVAELDEPHARLDEPPGQQALAAEVGGLLVVDAVECLGRIRLVGEVHHVGKRPCIRKASSYDSITPSTPGWTFSRSSSSRFIACTRSSWRRCEATSSREFLMLPSRAFDDRRDLVADARALVDRRQKRAAVVLRAAVARDRLDGDEAGQVLVLGAQAVERPGAERRPDELGVARVHHQIRLRMGGQVGVHAAG